MNCKVCHRLAFHCTYVYRGHLSPVTAVYYDAGENVLISGDAAGRVLTHSLISRKRVKETLEASDILALDQGWMQLRRANRLRMATGVELNCYALGFCKAAQKAHQILCLLEEHLIGIVEQTRVYTTFPVPKDYGQVMALTWTEEGFVSGHEDGSLVRWTLIDPNAHARIRAHSDAVTTLFAYHGWIVSAAMDATVCIWDQQLQQQFEILVDIPASCLMVTTWGVDLSEGWLFVGGMNGEVRVFHVQSMDRFYVHETFPANILHRDGITSMVIDDPFHHSVQAADHDHLHRGILPPRLWIGAKDGRISEWTISV